jgi:hypothetical protein
MDRAGDSTDVASDAIAASGGSTNPTVGSMDRAVHSMSMPQVRRAVHSTRTTWLAWSRLSWPRARSRTFRGRVAPAS